MPDRPNFPIPDELTPDTFCLCLQIPNNDQWKQVLIGLLAQPTYWFNWQRDAAHSGKELAAYWTKLFDDIDWTTMSCCCDQPPAIFRYNSDGVYQRSTDGGLTWTDAPEYDYRNTSTVFPPPSALGISNTKCQAADSAVQVLNEDVIQGLDNGAAVQAILEFIAAVLIFYLSAGTLATVSIGLFAMAAAIFGFGVASTKAAFTSTVLNQLRCSIYKAMSSDDAIDAAGFTALLIDINTNYTGIIKTSLYAIISAAGVVGVTNMIRSNRGSATADCSTCEDCDGCDTSAWAIRLPESGITGVINTGESNCNHLVVNSTGVNPTDGRWYIQVISPDPDAGCTVTAFTFTGSPFDILVAWDEPGDDQATFPHIGSPTSIVGHTITGLEVRTATENSIALTT